MKPPPLGTYRLAVVIILAATAIPAALYFYYLLSYAVNIPYWDDYDAVLAFLNQYLTAPGALEKLRLILSQHNEHRIVFDRLTFLGTYYLSGAVNFRFLIAFGNAALVLLTYVLFVAFRNNRAVTLLYFVPVPIMLFQLQAYENAMWAMASIQNFYVLVFALSALLLLSRPNRGAFTGACLLAVAATFTSGNGLLVFPTGLLVLLVQRRRWPYLLAWTATAAVAIATYFYGYQSPAHHFSVSWTLLNVPLHQIVTFFFTFIASAFSVFGAPGFGLYTGIGIAICLLYLYLLYAGYYRQNPAIMAMLFFILLGGTAAAASRTGFGLTGAYASRYTINSQLIIILLYLAYVDRLGKHPRPAYVLAGALPVALLFLVLGNRTGLGHLRGRHYQLHSTAGLFRATGDFSLMPYYNVGQTDDILLKSEQLGVYQLPDSRLLEEARPAAVRLPARPGDLAHRLQLHTSRSHFAVYDGLALAGGQLAGNGKVYVVLQSARDTLAFTTRRLSPGEATRYLGAVDDGLPAADRNSQARFTFVLPKNKLPEGDYRVGLLAVNGNRQAFSYTGQRLEHHTIATPVKELPVEQNRITMNLEKFVQDKEYVQAKGWAFLNGQDATHSTIRIALKTDSTMYLVKTTPDLRTDVTSHFKSHNLDRAGFSAEFPKSELKSGNYQVGIYIEDARNGNQDVAFTAQMVKNLNIVPEIVAQLPVESAGLMYNVEKAQLDPGQVSISGWAFREGQGMRGKKINIVLKSTRLVYKLPVIPFMRPDLTAHFKNDLDQAGFDLQFPDDLLPPGLYQVGILITNGQNGEPAFRMTDKSIRISRQ